MHFHLVQGVFCAATVQLLLVKLAFAAPSNSLFKDHSRQIDARSPVDCNWECLDEVDRPTFAAIVIQLSTCTNCVSATSYDNSFRIQCSACEGGCATPANNQCNSTQAVTTQKRDTSKSTASEVEGSTGTRTKRSSITVVVPDIGLTTFHSNNGVLLTITSYPSYAIFSISNVLGNQATCLWGFTDLDNHGPPIVEAGSISPGDPSTPFVEVLAIPGDRVSFTVVQTH